MKTVNTISGGRSSATNAILFPADFNVFSLVRIERPFDGEKRFDVRWMKGKDETTRKLIEDRIGCEFYGTAENDVIIYTILELEQKLGKEIKIITGNTFDHVIEHDGRCLPDPLRRFCTEELKIKPMYNWWYRNVGEVALFRIGYRKGEENRAVKMINKLNQNGNLEIEVPFAQTLKKKKGGLYFGGRMKHENFEWQKPEFKLIENCITRDNVWEITTQTGIPFAEKNNCENCFNQDPLYAAFRARKDSSTKEVMKWAGSKEGVKHKKDVWFKDRQITFEMILRSEEQSSLIDQLDRSDFSDCDTGFCGL